MKQREDTSKDEQTKPNAPQYYLFSSDLIGPVADTKRKIQALIVDHEIDSQLPSTESIQEKTTEIIRFKQEFDIAYEHISIILTLQIFEIINDLHTQVERTLSLSLPFQIMKVKGLFIEAHEKIQKVFKSHENDLSSNTDLLKLLENHPDRDHIISLLEEYEIKLLTKVQELFLPPIKELQRVLEEMIIASSPPAVVEKCRQDFDLP